MIVVNRIECDHCFKLIWMVSTSQGEDSLPNQMKAAGWLYGEYHLCKECKTKVNVRIET